MSDLVERLKICWNATRGNDMHDIFARVPADLLEQAIAALEAQPRLPRLPDGYSLVRKGDDLIECHKHGVECFTSYKASLTFEFLSAFFPQPAQPESVKAEGLVKAPNGDYIASTFSRFPSKCRQIAADDAYKVVYAWRQLYRRGYRCVPVKITGRKIKP